MRLLLGILVFGLWGSFARYWYVCKIKNSCELQEVVEKPTIPERLKNLNLSFGYENILEGYNQFSFQNGISHHRMTLFHNPLDLGVEEHEDQEQLEQKHLLHC